MSKEKSKSKGKRAFRAVGIAVLAVIFLCATGYVLLSVVQNARIDALTCAAIPEYSPNLTSTNIKIDSSSYAAAEFYILNDLHLLSESRLDDTEFGAVDFKGQIRLDVSAKIVKAAFDKIKADTEINTVLIPGDLTQYGDRESHEEVLGLLRDLEASGKQIFVIPASHDYKVDNNRAYINELYKPFNASKILSEAPDGFSFVVRLADGYRLLCLNADEGYSKATVDWVLNEIGAAKEAGDYLIEMQHYPIIEPTPVYSLFGGNDMRQGYKEVREAFADAGLEFSFCGHSHMHSVTAFETKKGNTMYSVSTAAISGYPALMRKVSLDDGFLNIQTVEFTDEEFAAAGIDTEGKTADEFMKSDFLEMLESVFYNAAYDTAALSDEAGAFSFPKKTVEQYKFLIQPVGLFIYNTKIGTLADLMLFGDKIEGELREKYIREFAVEIIASIYRGGAEFYPDTAEYKAVAYFFERLKPALKLFGAEGILDTVRDGVLYDGGPKDWDVVLIRQN